MTNRQVVLMGLNETYLFASNNIILMLLLALMEGNSDVSWSVLQISNTDLDNLTAVSGCLSKGLQVFIGAQIT